jgi:hypothetical protein
LSTTLRSEMRWKVWKMKPSSRLRTFASWRSRNDRTSRPLSATRPLDGASSSPMMFSSVLLPEPDGPMMETNSPASTVRLTFSRATVSIVSVRYTFSMFSS